MSENIGRYAQLSVGSNIVENVILMGADFTIKGYTFNALDKGQSCQPGAFYCESDGAYYMDSAFTVPVDAQATPDTAVSG